MFRWEILNTANSLEELKDAILKNRIGNLTKDDFLNPPAPVSFINKDYFSDDFLENLKKAKQLIFDAISEDTLILIHGDYDSDGVCATSIILDTLTKILNYNNVGYIIPDRFEDGYGLSDKTLQKLFDLAFNKNFLLITVDCGITAVSQIEKLKNLGNKVIITDHHHQSENIPKADAVVWSDKVVGSTLAWILSLGLGNKNPEYLSISSIATITDVFPLQDINRSIVSHGINILRKKPPFFITEMLKSLSKKKEEISTYDLGFVIGPRLNSSGRIGSANIAVEMITSNEVSKVSECVAIINNNNVERQKITSDSVDSIEIDENNIPEIIVSYNPSYHEGVMGLIASKILQKYNRPVLVISGEGDLLKGSARSLEGVNIVEILNKASELFISFGGHAQAAGFSLKPQNLEILKERILEIFKETHSDFIFEKKITIDSKIEAVMINEDLCGFINMLEPFGSGNLEPIFNTNGFQISEIKFIGAEKNHLSLKLSLDSVIYKAIFFNFEKNKYPELYLGQKIDIIYKVKTNIFNGKKNIDLHLIDIKNA
jgi:single-stranded-DNA-specific exonuclease